MGKSMRSKAHRHKRTKRRERAQGHYDKLLEERAEIHVIGSGSLVGAGQLADAVDEDLEGVQVAALFHRVHQVVGQRVERAGLVDGRRLLGRRGGGKEQREEEQYGASHGDHPSVEWESAGISLRESAGRPP